MGNFRANYYGAREIHIEREQCSGHQKKRFMDSMFLKRNVEK